MVFAESKCAPYGPCESQRQAERKLEIDEEDLREIIEDYLIKHADFDFDEIEVVNNRPMNIWLYAKRRKYVDPDDPGDDLDEVEVEVKGKYDDNPTRG